MQEETSIAQFRHLGFRRFIPATAIAHRVECYWSTGSFLLPAVNSAETLYPDGGSSLVIDLDRPMDSAYFQFNSFRNRWTFTSTTHTVSVRFRPGALYRLFGVSPVACCDFNVSAADLLTPSQYTKFASTLAKMDPENSVNSLRLIEQWLLAQEKASGSGSDRVRNVISTLSITASIGRMAAMAGVSTRTLERQFRREVGLRPSEFLSHQRIKLARARLAQSTHPLADIGLSCGFYDQAHFTKSFARLVGETPGHYRTRKLSEIYKP
ncbi:helix-turn-helix transcriptional regulator [Microbulbifer celer]|uniref:Helix-turn-helix domain-containing protein n=1 Tax=Microbulbifer celer TaxID=435905 RepID=A0ABW3UCB0_9GAMM|nr:helix-turn-helix transcriptional regulator [Microbulbifer celer]UFN56891.1 helix-turn-helix domain-containing protein [Microbulbifer celer]